MFSLSVQNLIDASGAMVLTYEEAFQIIKRDLMALLSNGFYNQKIDFIAVNENPLDPRNFDLVLLHELTHWTGHPNRLSRQVMIKCSQGIRPDLSEIHTEEATAQFGMYNLAIALGLDAKRASYELRAYLCNFPLADMAKAEYDGNCAAQYLLNMTKAIAA